MNDRFKFRTWNSLVKKFSYFDKPEMQIGTDGFDNGLIFLLSENSKLYMGKYSEPQFCTGLKDKNGKLIYKGDILKFKLLEDFAAFGTNEKYVEIIAPVIYEYGGFFIEQSENNIFLGQLPMSEIEVIGNIYENPELLKDGE